MATIQPTPLDPRDEKALSEYMTILPEMGRAKGAPGLFIVVSQAGAEYLVDEDLGACECPDHQYREVECKHIRAVRFATGERPIPEGATVRDDFGARVTRRGER